MRPDKRIDALFDVALKLEQNAASFYRRAIPLFENADIKAALAGLLAAEEGHQRILKILRQGAMHEPESAPAAIDPAAEAQFEAMAKERAQSMEERLAMLTGRESKVEILNIALDFEKEAVQFYARLKGIEQHPSDIYLADLLMREEEGHILILRDALNQLCSSDSSTS